MVTSTDIMIWVISIDSKLGFSHDNLGKEKSTLLKKILVGMSGNFGFIVWSVCCIFIGSAPLDFSLLANSKRNSEYEARLYWIQLTTDILPANLSRMKSFF